MVIPLTWDEDSITECAFVTRAFCRGKAVDQLQMHLRGGLERDGLVDNGLGTYRIVTVFFDHAGNEVEPVGIVPLSTTRDVLARHSGS